MGIDPIGYKPWTGERTRKAERVWVISRTIFRSKMRSKWIILLLVLGYLGVWAFPIIWNSLMPHQSLHGSVMAEQLGSPIFSIFSVMLASLVCSDLISEDLRNNSFVLYFSRAIKAESYLLGKILGAFLVLATFCLLPAIIMAVAVLGTQSGPDYLSGLGVLGITVLASFVSTFFLIPFGLLMSSLTKRKSHAAIGTFMTFTVLTIIGGIFSEFNDNWILASPASMLAYFHDWIFGVGIPYNIDGVLLAAVFAAFLIIPMALAYLRIHLKAEGK